MNRKRVIARSLREEEDRIVEHREGKVNDLFGGRGELGGEAGIERHFVKTIAFQAPRTVWAEA